jgi:hypothetical protein
MKENSEGWGMVEGWDERRRGPEVFKQKISGSDVKRDISMAYLEAALQARLR